MIVNLKGGNGRSTSVNIDSLSSIEDLYLKAESLLALEPQSFFLKLPGQAPLKEGISLQDAGLVEGSWVEASFRLLGGKPVQVRLLTAPLVAPDGSESDPVPTFVTVDLETDTPMREVKAQLEKATGIPVRHQKILMAGVGQLVVGDKRGPLGFSHSASTNNFYFATLSS